MSRMRCEAVSGAVLQILMLLLTALLCAATPSRASTSSTTNVNWLGPGIPAIADLNGDSIPDRASGIETGRSDQGFSFRMDVALSGSSVTKSFTVFSYEPLGLIVEALDVDGDHDLDLVISSHLLHRPVGVWLNDGTGFFSPGDSSKYASSLWQQKPALTTSNDSRPHVIVFARRPSVSVPRLEAVAIGIAHPNFTPGRFLRTHSSVRQSIRLRAPPSSFA